MRKSIIALAVAGSVAVGGAALAGPALAESAAPSASSPTAATAAPSTTPAPSGSAADRPSPQARITDALEGLVTDGTITQAQSDKVATTLAELPRGGYDGFEGHDGFGRAAFGQVAAAASKALGVSESDLQTELRSGRSVADVAKEKGVDLATITAAVTDAARTQIAAAVKDGKLTQAQADALTANLTDKITEEVNEAHDGDHGRGGRGGPFGGPDTGSTPAQAAPTS